MDDLLMKRGEVRALGVMKGDRERVTVGLRQKSCSIAGRKHQKASSQENHATLS